jgi:hypothetical protein
MNFDLGEERSYRPAVLSRERKSAFALQCRGREKTHA